MKKLLLFLSLLLSLSLPAAAETFEKVTDFSTLKAGDKIIIVVNYVQLGSSNPHYSGWMQSDFKCKMSAATSAYADNQDFDFSSETNSPIITLEESGNSNYPWLMKLGDSYIKSTATSTKNGISTSSTTTDACQIKFQTGTTNHEFNNSSASTRKYLRANVTNGMTGTTLITSGGSTLGFKPEIYRLKVENQGPVDYTLDIDNELTLEKNEMFEIRNLNIPADAPTLTWTSSNADVVAEDGGVLFALGVGTATLTASWNASTKYNAGSHEIAVTVIEPLEVVTATFSTTSISKAIDTTNPGTENVTFTALNSAKDNLGLDNFTFTSSNEGVATYDAATGVVTLKGVGSATITAAFTENAAKLYKFSDDSNTAITVTLTDINGPIGYELVNSLGQNAEEDYYTIAANYSDKYYAMSAETDVTKSAISAVAVNVTTDGIIEANDGILQLKLYKNATDGRYQLATSNLESNGILNGVSDGTALNISANSEATAAITFDGDYATINLVAGSTRLILYNTSSGFKHYASGNASNSSYAPVSLYKLNFVKAEAPIVGDFEGKKVGEDVLFTAQHSSHKLQYREWTRSGAEAAIQYGEWTDVKGKTYTYTIKTLAEGVTEQGIQARTIDSRGNASSIVGFFYDGDQTVTGIESVAAEAEGEAELYNLQGVRVNRAEAAPGLYIERRAGKTAKVIL